jgi:hypothetical protein
LVSNRFGYFWRTKISFLLNDEKQPKLAAIYKLCVMLEDFANLNHSVKNEQIEN